MTLVTRHIFQYLLASLAFMSMVLATGVWLTQSLRFVEIIVNRNVSIGGYFSLVGFLIPDLLATVLPICILISVLFTYNKLTADHELSIFRTLGLSNWRLARPALILAFGVACLVAMINVYIVPASFRHFRDMEYKIRNEFSSNFMQDGMFNSLRGVTVYARKRSVNGDLNDVFIHSTGGIFHARNLKKNPFTIIAQRGVLIQKEGRQPFLLLSKGMRQEKDEKTGKVSFFHFEALNYDLDQLASNLQERAIKPYERSLSDLLNPSDKNNLSPITQAQLRAEGHQRLLTPLLVLLFALIGLSALLPQELNRRSRHKHTFAAIGLSACTHGALIFLININGRWPVAIPLAYLTVVIMALIALFYLENQNIRSWWVYRCKHKNSFARIGNTDDLSSLNA